LGYVWQQERKDSIPSSNLLRRSISSPISQFVYFFVMAQPTVLKALCLPKNELKMTKNTTSGYSSFLNKNLRAILMGHSNNTRVTLKERQRGLTKCQGFFGYFKSASFESKK